MTKTAAQGLEATESRSPERLVGGATTTAAGSSAGPSVNQCRADFPILQKAVLDGRPLVYLDTGATAQKPRVVIDKLVEVFENYYANVHRGVHPLHERVTAELEAARRKVQQFLGAKDVDEFDEVQEIIFTSGTTMAINLVAQGWARKHLQPGDVVVVSQLEHHANLLPWQVVTQQTGAQLMYWPLTADGELDLTTIETVLTPRTKLLAITGMSNVLGTLPPLAEIIPRAHAVGAKVLVDGAQSVPHGPTNVQALDVDFLAFSGHKLYGPTGIGVLYGKQELLERMDPLLTGGNMVDEVFLEHSTYKAPAFRFEAGTLPIAEAIALGTAVDYVEQWGLAALHVHEQALLEAAASRLAAIDGVTVYGPPVNRRGAILSFTIRVGERDVPAHDIGTILASKGVAIRASHHCAQPLHKWLGVEATARVSFGMYNTLADVAALGEALEAGIDSFLRRRRG